MELIENLMRVGYEIYLENHKLLSPMEDIKTFEEHRRQVEEDIQKYMPLGILEENTRISLIRGETI